MLGGQLSIADKMKNSPFYISKLKSAFLSKGCLEVFLDSKDFLDARPLDNNGWSKNKWIIDITNRKNPSANFLNNQLKKINSKNKIQIATDKHPLRWLGSGALLILKEKGGKKYAILNKRHLRSAWGGYLDANGGYSSSVPDMLSPNKLGLRELCEEVIIFKNGKKVNLKKIKLKEIPLKFPTDVYIYYKNKKIVEKNLILIIDSKTATIDFRKIFELSISKISEYSLKDEETYFINQKSEINQNRNIFVMELEKLKKLKGKITPALKSIIKQL